MGVHVYKGGHESRAAAVNNAGLGVLNLRGVQIMVDRGDFSVADKEGAGGVGVAVDQAGVYKEEGFAHRNSPIPAR
jgi:hypothetical protein